ncbi:cytochrome c oxidase subunit II [Zunongwangia sp. F363]|uniref:cytochrome-c oxidase n=1 Tax=Autumnicola tepida TaxID=3075595 RepID=A0ABU3C660_9FLAO|nr:cytochrome c oxidase subunit II [Zunongwangia sp. F363]MDT0641804.1 cytochrome c oxidase subunit II [Zunongwangia sp. F363]
MEDIQFNQLGTIKELFIYFLIAASIILGLVAFFTAYYSWKYRKRKDDEQEPEQIHDNKKLEFSLIAVALSLVTLFFVLTINGMNKIQDIPEDPHPDILITGHQWWWEAEYSEDGLITANEIHVPTGKELIIQFNSDDVIHSWWVPAIGRKMDLVPGVDNYLSVKVEKEGIYWGSCSEFCGAQHGWMRIRLIAHSPEDFERWKRRQLEPKQRLDEELFKKGEQLFSSKACTSCHAISPTASIPAVGPNLANFGSRKYFLSNIKLNTEINLKAWLRDPGKVKSSAKMPDMLLDEDQIAALTHYLENLK